MPAKTKSTTKAKTRALTVRKLPADHYEWLREQAAAHGRSMEAEMRELVASAKRGLAAWPAASQAPADTKLRGFADPPSPKKLRPGAKASAKPAPKKKIDKDWLVKLQALVAKTTKKRAPDDLLSDEFLRERRAMWGEE
jgi:plasmid stability protein